MIARIIDLIKVGLTFFQKKEKNEQQLDVQNRHEQNQITLEETSKGFTWRQGLGWVLTFIILLNYVIVPVLAFCGVVLPILPIDEIWKVLFILIGGS